MKNSDTFKILSLSTFCLLFLVIFLLLGSSKAISGDLQINSVSGPAIRNMEEKTGLPENPNFLLRIGSDYFDPLARKPVAKAGLEKIESYEKVQKGYYILQFTGPVRNHWKKALSDIGVEFFDYIPEFAFIVRMSPELKHSVLEFTEIRWLGLYQPSYRISRSAYQKALTPTKAHISKDYETLRINIFPGEDKKRIIQEIEGFGGIVLEISESSWKTTLKVDIPKNHILNLPGIHGLKWIEPYPVWELYNNEGTDIMGITAPRTSHSLFGSGVIVAVADTGLDEGSTSPASLHDDFEDGSGGSRVLAITDIAGDGDVSDTNAHGTHVAGSVLGNGFLSGSDPASDSYPSTCFAGSAPEAQLYFQALGYDSSSSLTTPADLNNLFSPADSAGAVIHTNSWGSSTAGRYTAQSQDVDEYVWNHKDFLILYAAGNSGIDTDSDGVIDTYSLGSPGSAKNCLTVGATENNRPGISGTWGSAWPSDYPADPIFSDSISDNPDGLAAFSSRGPTYDGRYKPDVVGPGTYIISTRSQATGAGTGWGVYDANYLYNGGTSMSTPMVAGLSVLMREYLINEKSFFNPSAALIKAAIMNSAVNITPGQYGTGIYKEIPDTVPNKVIGWGRPNLENGTYPTGPFGIDYHDVTPGLSTGGYDEYMINVTGSTNPLKVNLVWTDYPGSPTSDGGLVNDLDLRVTDPSAAVHYPDNPAMPSMASQLVYDSGSSTTFLYGVPLAVRFTPGSYPVHIDGVRFRYYNKNSDDLPVDVVVYQDSGGVPGTELQRRSWILNATGWWIIPLDLNIESGDFWIAIECPFDSDHGIYSDPTDPLVRSYYYDGLLWNSLDSKGFGALFIRANVRVRQPGTTFDRINNAVGLTIDSPATGAYTVRVEGYSVPYGPQAYALVISGDITTGGTGHVKRNNSTYTTLQEAYDASVNTDTLYAHDNTMHTFTEPMLDFDRAVNVTLRGGCNMPYTPVAGQYTDIDGSFTISAGSATVYNIVIQ